MSLTVARINPSNALQPNACHDLAKDHSIQAATEPAPRRLLEGGIEDGIEGQVVSSARQHVRYSTFDYGIRAA